MSTTALPEIDWKVIHGKKTYHKLHPSMLGDGLVKELEIRPVPYRADLPKAKYAVMFDRSYAVTKLAEELADFENVPFIDLVELVAEAYAIVNPDAPIVGRMPEIRKAFNGPIDPLALSGSW